MQKDHIVLIEQDIKERKDIVDRYQKYGLLDRDEAISKIKSLRKTDYKVAAATGARLLVNAVSFENATNDQIIAELQMQISILCSELLEDSLLTGP